MKTMSCDNCDATFSAETFQAWVELMKPHYAQEHKEFMASKASLSPEEQQKEMQQWFAEQETRFNQLED